MQYELAERKIASRFLLKPEHEDEYSSVFGISSSYELLATQMLRCTYEHNITVSHDDMVVLRLTATYIYEASEIMSTSAEQFTDIIDHSYDQLHKDYINTVKGHYLERSLFTVDAVYDLDEISELLGSMLN